MFKLLKSIFLDIILLYRNFLHFNISKIIIYLVSILYAVIMAVSIIVLTLVLFPDIYNWVSINIYSVIENNLFLLLFLFIGFILIYSTFLYNVILFNKLNLYYIEWNKLNISKNNYFNFKLFLIYFKIILLIIWIFILFLIIYLLLLSLILIPIFWWVENVKNIIDINIYNNFSIVSLLIASSLILLYFYLIYRIIFSLIILVNEYEKNGINKISYYIKKSFNITKGFKKVFKFVSVFIFIIILAFPISIPISILNSSFEKISDYISIRKWEERVKKLDYRYKQDLILEFWEDKILLDLYKELNKKRYVIWFLYILNFMFIYGLFEMMFVSFYKRELIKN